MNRFFHIFLLVFVLLVLVNGQQIVTASSQALILWFEKLLPSMFVGMVLIRLVAESGLLAWLFRPLEKGLQKCFRMNAQAFSMAFLALLLGFPASAMLCDEAVKEGRISPAGSRRLIECCHCASISFIIVTVGGVLLHSIPLGVLLWLVQVCSVVTLLVVTRSVPCEMTRGEQSVNLLRSLSRIVLNSMNTMLIIAGYLMMTLSFMAIFQPFLPDALLTILQVIAEFSSGCVQLASLPLSEFAKLVWLGMLLSFGGICVLMQILGSCEHSQCSLFRFLFMRLLQCLLSIFYTYILFTLW